MELIRLSDQELKKLHKDGRPSNVRFSEEDGGGSMGALNVIHLLHCVVRTLFVIMICWIQNNVKDSIRKHVYSDDYPTVQEWRKTRPILMKYHIGTLSCPVYFAKI